MRALRYTDGGLTLATAQPEPIAPPGWALVRVRAAGICRTDLEIARGDMGFRGTLGHEFVGQVVEAAAAPGLVGQRVVGEINLACGTCEACRAGRTRHCPTRSVLGIVAADGAFADLLCMPIPNLFPVPDDVSDPAAVFTEPLAAALQILEQVEVSDRTRAVVLGDGRLGLLAAMVLRDAGAATQMTGRHPRKLEMARRLGIGIEPATAGADLVVDATGSPDGLARALELVRPRGTIVLKTTSAAGYQIDLAPAVINEITIVGSRCGQFGPALRALKEHRFDVEQMVDATYPLDEAIEALAEAGRPGVLKVLLLP